MENKRKSFYEIAFTERDNEVRSLEMTRAEIERELEVAMAEYAKLAKRRSLGKKLGKKKNITPLLLEGKAQRN